MARTLEHTLKTIKMKMVHFLGNVLIFSWRRIKLSCCLSHEIKFSWNDCEFIACHRIKNTQTIDWLNRRHSVCYQRLFFSLYSSCHPISKRKRKKQNKQQTQMDCKLVLVYAYLTQSNALCSRYKSVCHNFSFPFFSLHFFGCCYVCFSFDTRNQIDFLCFARPFCMLHIFPISMVQQDKEKNFCNDNDTQQHNTHYRV